MWGATVAPAPSDAACNRSNRAWIVCGAFVLRAIVYGFLRRTDETGVKTMSRLRKGPVRNAFGVLRAI